MQLHNLKRNTKNKKRIQVGRGGKRGKTAGRGTKGQKARAGRKIRPEIRDTIKRLPKLRGYSFKSIETKPLAISISLLEKNFENGKEINHQALLDAKIVSIYKGKTPKVKIVGGKGARLPTPEGVADGGQEITLGKKLTVVGIPVSASVRAAIEKAGGEVKAV